MQNIESEVPSSPVIPVPQTPSLEKPTVLVTTAGEMAGPSATPVSTPPAHLTSLPTNVVTLRSVPGLPQSLQKSTVQQLSLQITPNVMSHSQHKSTEPMASTAVVYTVKSRPTQLTVQHVQHDGNKEQNRFQAVSHSPAIETNTRYLQTMRTGQPSEPLASKTFQQPQLLEQRKSLPGVPSLPPPSQTNSTLEMMRQNQQKLLQQRQMMQQQKHSLVVVSPAQQQQVPSQSTASLLQQLQRQQQLQQQQHYQRLAQQQPKSQVRHLSTPPGQMSQQEQYRKQQLEAPLSSVSASAQQQQEPSPQQNQQQQSVRPPSGLLLERQQFVRSPTLSTSQQRNHSPNSQSPMYALVQRQSNSQPSTASNPPPSSFSFNARHLNNVLKRDETTVMTSVGRSHVPFVPSQQVSQSPSTSPKQTSLSNQRVSLVNSNTLVQDHINKIVNHPHNGRLASPVHAAAIEMRENPSVGGQQNATLQRQETATDCSSSSQAVSTTQFRKSFPGQTLQTRTELVPTLRYHSRPPPESLQQHVQHPNTQTQQGDRQLQQPQPDAIQKHSTPETGRENVSTMENSQLRGASSALTTTVMSTYRKVQPRPENQRMQQSILVPARKKHTNEELLPSGYRFSLPSPEYLLQRQRLQQQTQAHTQNTQNPPTSQIPKSQSIQNTSSSESLRVTASPGQTREPTRIQSPAVELAAIQRQLRFQSAQNDTRNDRVLNQTSRNEVPPSSGYRPSSENWLTQQKQQELQAQQQRHTHQSQTRQMQQPPQGQEQVNAPQLTRERGTQRINLQSLCRPPIQSPGISSSDPRNEKHLQDAERTSVSNLVKTNNSSNDNENAHKPLPKPSASIAVMDRGIVLSWNMEYDDTSIKIDNYELFACQDFNESKGQPIKWKKIGIVKALPLPMACTLTQFSSGSKYCFSVRAVDEKERAGPFSDPCTVSLNPP